MLDHLERLFEAQSIEEIWNLHIAKMAEYGFDRLIYGFTRFRTTKSFGNLDDMLVLSNHSKEFLDGFVGQGLYHHAPMVRWAAENVGACSWRWIDEQARTGHFTPSELKVMDFNLKMGVPRRIFNQFQRLVDPVLKARSVLPPDRVCINTRSKRSGRITGERSW